mmetsp:Transcript_3627/g.9417  ORF Transcript_3627/g.9417 Transcript_3627/m.9417 type:complete len:243 (+) Transcript_3627:540-1268(+)
MRLLSCERWMSSNVERMRFLSAAECDSLLSNTRVPALRCLQGSACAPRSRSLWPPSPGARPARCATKASSSSACGTTTPPRVGAPPPGALLSASRPLFLRLALGTEGPPLARPKERLRRSSSRLGAYQYMCCSSIATRSAKCASGKTVAECCLTRAKSGCTCVCPSCIATMVSAQSPRITSTSFSLSDSNEKCPSKTCRESRTQSESLTSIGTRLPIDGGPAPAPIWRTSSPTASTPSPLSS